MNIIEIIKALVYGIIQGITEWLPISSTGHLILAEQIPCLKMNVSENFWEGMFLVLIQLGSIFAVVFLFFHKLNPLSSKKTITEKKSTWQLWAKVIVGSIPAVVVGFALKITHLKKNLEGNPIVVSMTLIIIGILFIIVESSQKSAKTKSLSDISYRLAFLIGICQAVALIPGVSRSGATIIGAVMLGASRYVATEFSFFLAIPAMFGASLLEIITYKGTLSSNEVTILIVGMFVAFIVSVLIIRFMMNFVKKHNFKGFGYYRIALGIITLIFFLTSTIKTV